MRFLKANLIYPVSSEPVQNGVLILNEKGQIEELRHSAEGIPEDKTEWFEGSICPGFINTHCHLELSHLKGQIEEKKGIIQFAKDVMKLRGSYNNETILASMLEAENEMKKNGIVAVGDISNTSDSFAIKSIKSLFYHTFIELIGLNPSNAERILQTGNELLTEAKNNNINASLAPHAPYSTSKEIMQRAAAFSKEFKLPTSIHNQESEAENIFFENKSGAYLDLYSFLNLNLDYFTPTGNSSLQSYIDSMQESFKLLMVHNTFSTRDDILSAQKLVSGLYWCLCPAANLYIENTLPDVIMLKESGCSITLGTDSLASNSSLSIAEEMRILKTHFPSLQINELIQWATLNGAEFLGIQDTYGSLEKGKTPGIVVLDEKDFSVRKIA